MTEIKAYISEELENSTATRSTISRITKSIRILENHAMAGAQRSSVANVDMEYRFLVSGNDRVFYRAIGSGVYVDRVLYGRREYLRSMACSPATIPCVTNWTTCDSLTCRELMR